MGSRAERTAHRFGVALRFALCASAAWLCAFAYELCDAASSANAPAQLGYASELAITCSLWWLPGVALSHAVWWALRTFVGRAEPKSPTLADTAKAGNRRSAIVATVVHCALLAAVVAVPSARCAALLTGGTGMLDVANEPALRVGLTIALVAGYVAVWLVHLALCARPAPRWIARRSPRSQRLLSLAGLAFAVAAVCGFAWAADEELRAYNFLVAFLMPAVWLGAASAVYAATMRSSERQTWTVLLVALVVGPAAYAQTDPSRALRAKAELIRRGGLIALGEAATQFKPPPRFANLAVTDASTSRFDCVVPEPRANQTALTTPVDQRRNVILISVDALRRDVLGSGAAPALEAFAVRSLVFERAITPYPATLFALGAVLTGVYPSELLLAPATLPDVLQLTAANWDTRVAVWPDVVWFRGSALPGLITRNLEPTLLRGAQRQTDHLIAQLRAARETQRRTFAWIHYYEPHMSQLRAMHVLGETARARYDALVRLVDVQLGRLLSELERLGYFDDSLVLLFGDHGEALGELGYYGHHVYLNQFIGDIPLVVHAPGLAPERSERVASLTDLAPTLLEWTATPAPALSGDAQSLFEIARREGERYALSEAFPVRGKLLFDLMREPIRSKQALDERLSLVQSGTADYQPKVALVSSRERLIVNRVTGDEEFYDRATDPLEQHDLSARGLRSHARMRSELRRVMRRMSERIYCRVAALPTPEAPTADKPRTPTGEAPANGTAPPRSTDHR